ncbi:unnamed protein product [Echinostoma caproni]|uniref:B box-type domain-containing protein n=1 Tax=Echinostoma caproni TaxID=27848 RepID=A0A183A809_9TREM|nr:unnamed protein product [Echinostoma caproni]
MSPNRRECRPIMCKVCEQMSRKICNQDLYRNPDADQELLDDLEDPASLDPTESDSGTVLIETLASDNGASVELPAAVFVQNLRMLAKLIEDEVDFECDCCRFESNQSKAGFRCIECGDNLCENCARAHRLTKLTRLHTLIHYQDIVSAECLPKVHKAPQASCSDHVFEDQAIDSAQTLTKLVDNLPSGLNGSENSVLDCPAPPACAYCKQCRQMLCAQCSGQFSSTGPNQRHVQHLVVPLEQAVHAVKSEMDYVRSLTAYGFELTELHSTLSERIDARAEELHRRIAQLAEGMKQQLTEQINTELSNLDRYIRPLGPLIAQCEVATQIRPEFIPGESALDQDINHESDKVHLFGKLIISQECEDKSDPNMVCHSTMESTIDHSADVVNAFVSTGVNTTPRQCIESLKWPFDKEKKECDMTDKIPGLQPNGNGKETETVRCSSYATPRPNGTDLNDSQWNGLTNEFEFDARVPTDSRDVWPTGLAIHQPTGNICVVDRDNARLKASR